MNFPHVVKIGLPALKAARKSGRTERDSRLAALLAIMSHLDDTCVLYRGGPEAQRMVHEGAARVIKVGGPGSPKGNAALIALGQELVSLRISPGGSADLLAATLSLDALERGLERVEKDNSGCSHGRFTEGRRTVPAECGQGSDGGNALNKAAAAQ